MLAAGARSSLAKPHAIRDHSRVQPGEVIDRRFRLEREVARGGTSRVWRGHDLVEQSVVAIKVVTCPDHDSIARFAREVSVLIQVSHPGIVRYIAHGAASADDRYLALQWIDGIDLAARLQRPTTPSEAETLRVDTRRAAGMEVSSSDDCTLSLAETLRLARRIALALDALHTCGWVHRDVKPANILLPSGSVDEAVLVDLGTARSGALVEDIITLGGMLVGTPSYMSPEQASATGQVGPATDIWSLGCVMYRALTGRTPFEGGPLLAVLARILTDDPTPLASLRPDVPDDVLDLVARMLTKEPEGRPRDGAEAHAELTALEERHSTRSEHPTPMRPKLATRERRARCVLVARADTASAETISRIVTIAGDTVDEIHRLADGSVLLRVLRDATALDRARRAASAALALRAALPKLRFALATERLDDGLDDDVVTRAAHLVDVAKAGEVQLDAGTAELLDLHFVVARDSGASLLTSARSLDGARTLLGRPTPWVGRRRELAQILSLFLECTEEPMARAALVIGEAGIGKSRLRAEVLRALRESTPGLEILFAQADSVGAGAPFAMIAAALRDTCGVREGESEAESCAKVRARIGRHLRGDDADRISALLGEIAGTPFPDDAHPALQAVRRDPLLMNGFALAAWLDWLTAECAQGPLVIVLDDLHWGDVPTLRFVDAALGRLADRPFFVLSLARPEVKTVFPSLWQQRSVQEIRLEGLSRKAATQLVRGVLGDRVLESVVEGLVERSAGNAFFLEELIRSVAEGGGEGEPPSTVLAVLHARLGALGEGAKRVLCAASIFGEIFTASGVRALVGDPVQAFGLVEWLGNLVEREVLTRHAASADGDAFKFRHALVRDASYDLLLREDRINGHLAAAVWLEQTSFTEPLALAEQFVRGGEPKRAVRWFRRAAEQALEGRDLEAVHKQAERGLECGAEREDKTALRWLQAVAAYWQSRYANAARYASEAVETAERGSREWFLATAEVVVSSARLADFATVEARFAEASSTTAAEGAEAAQLVCLCRSTFQMIFHGRFKTSDDMLSRIDVLATDMSRFDPLTAAQIHHVRGVRAAHAGCVSTFLHHLELAVEAFDRGADRNNVLLERTTVGWCWAEIGDFVQAERKIRESLAACVTANAQQAITYAKVNLGFALIYRPGALEEAVAVLDEAIAECRAVGNARLEGWASAHASTAALLAGRHAGSLEHAAAAVRLLASAPSLLGWAEACNSRACLAVGRIGEAVASAHHAREILVTLGGMLQGEAMPPLVLAEALHAAGRTDEAREAVLDARARLERRVERLTRPEWRESFLAIPDNARTVELARQLTGR